MKEATLEVAESAAAEEPKSALARVTIADLVVFMFKLAVAGLVVAIPMAGPSAG